MADFCEVGFLEDLYVTDVRVISGIRPRGRIVDKTADGRHESGLVYIWNGETAFRDGGSLTVAHPGDLIYIPKGKKYRMEYTADGTTFVLVNFNTYRTSGEEVLLSEEVSRVARDDGESLVARVMTSFELCAASMDASAIFRRKELLYRLFGIIYGSRDGVPGEVRDFEPKLALTAPDDGLQLILKTIDALAEHLNPHGGAIFELSPEQAPPTAAALESAGLTAAIIRDLCGRDRFVAGKLP